MALSAENTDEDFRRINSESDPQRALVLLLDACARLTSADSSRLYQLHLAKAAYIQTIPVGTSAEEVSLVDETASAKHLTSRDSTALVRIVEAKELAATPNARSVCVIPIIRDGSCLGLLVFHSKEHAHFTQEYKQFLSRAATVALLLLDKENASNLFRALQIPVDYHQTFEEFLDDLMLVIAESSRMPLIAIRERRDEALHCLKAFGFPDQSEDQLHLTPIADFPKFFDAVEKRQTQIGDRRDPASIQFLSRMNLHAVRSFIVVPVLVGTEVFGTLSFAVRCDHEYTTFEQQGLQTIANAVGVAIANYRNFHAAEDSLFNQAQIAAAITTVEVAQSARHEARNHLQSAQDNLTIMYSKASALPTKVRDEFVGLVEGVSDQVQAAEAAMQKIKLITKPPEREKTPLRVDEIWRDAFGLTLGRLEHLHIEWHVRGTGTATVARDYVRTAFLQLILNSIDAFKATKKRGRLIEVTIDGGADKARELTIKYVDNATGIDISKLTPPAGDQPRKLDDVFLAGVTSKPSGSGYGLYLLRKIIGDYQGSVDLIDHRNGVVFQIKLPKSD